jgi:Neprosin
MRIAKLSVSITLSMVASLGIVHAQTQVKKFVPFNQFVALTTSASSENYVGAPGNHVQDAAAFEQMRQHILNLYTGVHVNHSFLLQNTHVDCIPVMEQPSVRLTGATELAAPPPSSLGETESTAGDEKPMLATQVDAAHSIDAFGNSTICEAGTIPMARVTLEQMSHFATLANFFQKSPGEHEASAQLTSGKAQPPASPGVHVYSFVYSPEIVQTGITDGNNLWSPTVTTDQYFSLSQLWEIGESRLGYTQTAETGWQVYPSFYGTNNAALFIYWTADGYYLTGCYNLTCPAFTQTNGSYILGAAFSDYSTAGGTQYELDTEYRLYENNWWLFVNGAPLGYYPARLYAPGTMEKYAFLSEYGTESVSSTTVDPPEGSGAWSDAGYGLAAYHRNLNYISMTGVLERQDLTGDEPNPTCYTVTGPYVAGGGWGEYFYDGGPGGGSC